MSSVLAQVIDTFRDLRVLVIGDVMLDSYLEGTTDRLCREAPVPVVSLNRREDRPGGAANTAANLHGLGAAVTLLAVTGADLEGNRLRQILADQGITTDHMPAHPARGTLAKQRIIAAGQMLVRFDQGSTDPVDLHTEQLLIERLREHFPRSDAVIISDYGYGGLTRRVIQTLAELQAGYRRVVVVDAKDLVAYRHVGVTAVKPNYAEAMQLLGSRASCRNGARVDTIAAHGPWLLEQVGTQIAAVTLDTDGALIFERGNPPYRTYARPTPPSRSAGAGDTFVSALALALAAGAGTPTAAELASAAAALVVAQDGTVTCTANALREYVSTGDRYITDRARLVERVERYRRQGRRVVFTNGCFDIIHRGHIDFLNRARVLGDVLIVGVNTDASARRVKGPARPINPLEDRIEVLAALSSIDHLVAFAEDTPCALIQAIRPDVFVKGGDYTRAQLPEAELVEQLGGRVQILPHLDDRSTTRLIARIRADAVSPERMLTPRDEYAVNPVEPAREVGG
ncbi:MAG: D-glycero-beta-D-manno-heptose 1-phosphate adenylyltransferase [Chloroflexaceae bacterium]